MEYLNNHRSVLVPKLSLGTQKIEALLRSLSQSIPEPPESYLPGGAWGRRKRGFLSSIIVFFIFWVLSLSPLHAQSIDMEEMRQDINILESVLEEMFETGWNMPESSIVRVYSGSISFGERAEEVEGIYLPGLGIIFTIPNLSTGYITYLDDGDESTGFNSFAKGKRVTKESIINKIVEFLGQYGSTIDQLSPDDKIMVIYKSRDPENTFVISFSPSDDEKLKHESIPTITVIAEYGDIRAYQKDGISKSEFKNRLNINTTSKKEDKQTDLKIMANILKTAFDDGSDEQFEIRGDVNYLKIDNFGALFSFEIDYGNQFGIINLIPVHGVSVNVPEIDIDFDLDDVVSIGWNDSLSSVTAIDSSYIDSLQKILKSVRVHVTEIREQFEESRKEIEKERKQLRENMQQALDSFLARLKEAVIDYGPTLDSIPPNQRLLFSVEVHSGFDELPERIVLQVEKSVLRAVERDEIDEEEAMERIAVRKIQ